MTYSTMENGDKWKAFKSWWPIVITALAITVTAAQANTRLDGLGSRVEIIETRGTVPGNERITRVEVQIIDLQRTLNRIEEKLDNELSISPAARRRLNKLSEEG